MGDAWGGSWGTSWGLSWTRSGVTPPTPTPTPTPDAGGAGSIVGRRPEYKSTLEHYRKILAREERQEEIRQLDQLSEFVERLAQEQEQKRTEELRTLQAGFDRLLDEIAEGRRVARRIAELNELAAIEARRRDDEAAIAVILALS